MKKKVQKRLCIAVCLLVLFVIWTLLVRFVDVREIGPRESAVGFSMLNGFVHELTGVHMSLYTLSDWLGLVPIFTAFGFAVLGFAQWINRKNPLKVDFSILALGVFYMVVIAVYTFFEIVIVNYRPVLIDGYLEASYPSSTTLLVMCVMPTTAIQLNDRIKNAVLRRCVIITIIVFTVFMVTLRLISGVHWVIDIIGGAILCAGLVTMYDGVCRYILFHRATLFEYR